jgi:DNA end-binding protein Ku
MPSRSLWRGSISFGLVNVPVRLYSAVREHKLRFHFIHEPDGSPIGYQKVCKAEDEAVPDEEIVKAYEVSKDEFVTMTDEDFEAAQIEGHHTIDITDFVPAEDIDPIYFAKSYLVGPDDGAEKVYRLLVRAMEQTELAAIAKFVMRDRQYLGALRVRDGVITLEQLYFADEINPLDELRPSGVSVDKRELQMATQLIDSFTGDWKPEKYEDTYRKQLLKVIDAKRKGREIRRPPEPEEEEAPDLMAALRASVERARSGERAPSGGGRRQERSRSRNGRPKRGGRPSLASLSKSELEERARKAGVEGRSKMSKDQLVRALGRS